MILLRTIAYKTSAVMISVKYHIYVYCVHESYKRFIFHNQSQIYGGACVRVCVCVCVCVCAFFKRYCSNDYPTTIKRAKD